MTKQELINCVKSIDYRNISIVDKQENPHLIRFKLIDDTKSNREDVLDFIEQCKFGVTKIQEFFNKQLDKINKLSEVNSNYIITLQDIVTYQNELNLQLVPNNLTEKVKYETILNNSNDNQYIHQELVEKLSLIFDIRTEYVKIPRDTNTTQLDEEYVKIINQTYSMLMLILDEYNVDVYQSQLFSRLIVNLITYSSIRKFVIDDDWYFEEWEEELRKENGYYNEDNPNIYKPNNTINEIDEI